MQLQFKAGTYQDYLLKIGKVVVFCNSIRYMCIMGHPVQTIDNLM